MLKKMPRAAKYDEIPFEKVVFSSKLCIYITPKWEILFPIVEIIRLLHKNSIIAYRIGKGQDIIKTYGSQYNHRIVGYDLKKKQDFLENLKCVKCIIVFSDTKDLVVDNLITYSKNVGVLLICYSNLDSVYHIYDKENKETVKKPEEVLEKMYNIINKNDLSKLNDLFPEFDILEEPEKKEVTVLEKCIQRIKKTSSEESIKKEQTVKIYDIHYGKLKKMEYLRSMNKVVYDDDVEKINKQLKNTGRSLSSFFKK